LGLEALAADKAFNEDLDPCVQHQGPSFWAGKISKSKSNALFTICSAGAEVYGRAQVTELSLPASTLSP
jgi:hypothetical protein